MTKKLLFSLLFVFVSAFVLAQDIHFSQFNNSPQNLNPALAGVFNGDYRIVANHKNQWRTVPVAYKTYCISADAKLPLKLKHDFICAGILLNNDKSGDGAFRSNQAAVTVAYIKKLNSDSTSFLSIGVQPSIISKGFTLSKLSFDNQFNGDSYNSNISSGEDFSSTKINYFDASVGANWLLLFGKHSSVDLGFAYSHLNKTNQSFFSDKIISTVPKSTFHAGAVLDLANKFELCPSVLFQKQGKYQEVVVGSFAKFIFDTDYDTKKTFSIGVFSRLKDAFIAAALLDYNRFQFGLSYDVNTSGFKSATNGLGGFEFSVIYIMKRFVPVHANKILCPVYL